MIIFICFYILMRRLSTKSILIMKLLFCIWFFVICLCQNIILINEESLILICFLFVVLLFLTNFTYLTNSVFEHYILQKKEEVNSSLQLLINTLNKFFYFKEKSFLIQLLYFKHHWICFTRNFVYWNMWNILQKIKFLYFNCFSSLMKTFEYRALKLVHISLNKRLYQICIIENFFRNNFEYTKFMSSYLISLRELLRT